MNLRVSNAEVENQSPNSCFAHSQYNSLKILQTPYMASALCLRVINSPAQSFRVRLMPAQITSVRLNPPKCWRCSGRQNLCTAVNEVRI